MQGMNILTGILLSGLGFFAARPASAQGTLYLSNLAQPSVGSIAVGNDQWVAVRFNTGPASEGYTLDSIQMLMESASGNPNGFNVSLYSYDQQSPGSSLGSFSGPDPSAGGIFT
jgi:hypothetical protein